MVHVYYLIEAYKIVSTLIFFLFYYVSCCYQTYSRKMITVLSNITLLKGGGLSLALLIFWLRYDARVWTVSMMTRIQGYEIIPAMNTIQYC